MFTVTTYSAHLFPSPVCTYWANPKITSRSSKDFCEIEEIIFAVSKMPKIKARWEPSWWSRLIFQSVCLSITRMEPLAAALTLWTPRSSGCVVFSRQPSVCVEELKWRFPVFDSVHIKAAAVQQVGLSARVKKFPFSSQKEPSLSITNTAVSLFAQISIFSSITQKRFKEFFHFKDLLWSCLFGRFLCSVPDSVLKGCERKEEGEEGLQTGTSEWITNSSNMHEIERAWPLWKHD